MKNKLHKLYRLLQLSFLLLAGFCFVYMRPKWLETQVSLNKLIGCNTGNYLKFTKKQPFRFTVHVLATTVAFFGMIWLNSVRRREHKLKNVTKHWKHVKRKGKIKLFKTTEHYTIYTYFIFLYLFPNFSHSLYDYTGIPWLIQVVVECGRRNKVLEWERATITH